MQRPLMNLLPLTGPESRADRVLLRALQHYAVTPGARPPDFDDSGQPLWLTMVRTPQWDLAYALALEVEKQNADL